jgi:hypothetical protein
LGNPDSINYGQKFVYEPTREIDFPDFRLKFLGTKPNGSTGSLQLGAIYEFQVVTPTTSQVIQWSSGTGDIGPEVFEAQGKCLWLELRSSDNYGKLQDSEAVISLDRRKPSSCANR